MRPERRRLLGWLGAAAWGGLIFWLSSTPDAGGVFGFLPSGSDKVLHGGAFMVLAGLLTLATGRPLLAAALALGYGTSDEVHQLFVPGRTADFADLLADGVGAAAGSLLVGYLLREHEAPTVE